MPTFIKRPNAAYFLEHIDNEIANCNYTFNNDYLMIYINNIKLAEIKII
jgi:hypothetical protein